MGTALLILATPGIAIATAIVGIAAWEAWQDRRRAKALDEISERD